MRPVSILTALALPLAAAALTSRATPPAEPAGSVARHLSDASPGLVVGRLQEFLDWAHPADEGCGVPSGVRIVETWPGGLRARYEIVCAAKRRSLEGVFLTRQGEGVWQVYEGFEAEPERIEAALEDVVAPGSGSRGEIPPPPDNEAPAEAGTPMRVVAPPTVTREARPGYPEEAGRARLIGEARVEVLVEISPEGSPVRARPLRGPDPDLGMRRAAIEAVLDWGFRPAMLAGRAVRYFAPFEITFAGLPARSRDWAHRALFHIEAIVSPDRDAVEEARRRLQEGEAFDRVAATLAAGAGRGGDWGFVSAVTLPAPVRKALHEAQIGGYAGPVAAEGLHYLMLKRGEVYYAIRTGEGDGAGYQVLHQSHAPQGEALRAAIESDIADYLAESRRVAYMNEAARLMGIRQVRAQMGQLLIHTDALDESEVRMLGQVVEATVLAHQGFWAPRVPLRPFQHQVQVFALARREDHERLHGFWHAGKDKASPEHSPEGEYIPASRILSFPCEGMQGHLPVPMVIHEAIHMLDFERVYGAGVRPSPWFEEGLATYFGFSQIGSQLRIEPGDIRRSGTIVTDTVRLQFDPRAQLREHLKRNLEEGPVPLRLLLESGSGDAFWGGGQAGRAYGASWTLVHFLMHGRKGALRERFLDYAALEARGEGGPEAFARLFGPDLGGLEEAWHDHEKRL